VRFLLHSSCAPVSRKLVLGQLADNLLPDRIRSLLNLKYGFAFSSITSLE